MNFIRSENSFLLGNQCCLPETCYLPGGNSASSMGVSADCLGIIIIWVRTTYNLTACLRRTNYITGINCLGSNSTNSLGVSTDCLGTIAACLGNSSACLGAAGCLRGTVLAPWELALTACKPELPAWEMLPAWRDSTSSQGVSADCLGIIISWVRTSYNLTACWEELTILLVLAVCEAILIGWGEVCLPSRNWGHCRDWLSYISFLFVVTY